MLSLFRIFLLFLGTAAYFIPSLVLGDPVRVGESSQKREPLLPVYDPSHFPVSEIRIGVLFQNKDFLEFSERPKGLKELSNLSKQFSEYLSDGLAEKGVNIPVSDETFFPRICSFLGTKKDYFNPNPKNLNDDLFILVRVIESSDGKLEDVRFFTCMPSLSIQGTFRTPDGYNHNSGKECPLAREKDIGGKICPVFDKLDQIIWGISKM